jgi:cation transport regulator
MPYEKLNELPDSVHSRLPDHVQKAYKEIFDAAWSRYRVRRHRDNSLSRETVAHRSAWSAVKEKYPDTISELQQI